MPGSLGCKSKTHLTWKMLACGYWLLCAACVPSLSSGSTPGLFLIIFTAEKWQDAQESELQETAHHLHSHVSLQFLTLIEEEWEGRRQGTQGCRRLLSWGRLARYEGISWSVYASSLQGGLGKSLSCLIWVRRLRRYTGYKSSFLPAQVLKMSLLFCLKY